MQHLAPIIHNITPGWIVTFIIDARGGGASSGYISTGFFSGEPVFLKMWDQLT